MGGGTAPVVRQVGYRGRDDSVALNSTTWPRAQNTDWAQAVDVIFRLRLLLSDSVASTKTSNYTFGLEFSLNGGAFTAVGAATAVQVANSAQFVDDDLVTSSQITGGQNTFVNGRGDENGVAPSSGNLTLGNGNDHTEIEFALLIDSAQVADTDTIQIRATGTDATPTQTPTITVSEAAPSARIEVSWVELQSPDTATDFEVSWAELETPESPTRVEVSWGELETPESPTRLDVSWAELETPSLSADTRLEVSWAEFESPDTATDFEVSWAELETPESPTRLEVSWGELETPESPTRLDVSWAELETLESPTRIEVSWTEFAAGDSPSRIEVSWAELEVAEQGEMAPRKTRLASKGRVLITGGG